MSISDNLDQAEKLHENYFRTYAKLTGKSFNIFKTMIHSRLVILFFVWLFIVINVLYKYRPNFVMNTRKTYEEKNKLSMYYLFLYSLIISAILFIISIIIIYKYQKLKILFFKSEDCDLCRA